MAYGPQGYGRACRDADVKARCLRKDGGTAMAATKPGGAGAEVVMKGAAEDGMAAKAAAFGDIDDSPGGAKQQAGRPLQAKGVAITGRSHAEAAEKVAPDMRLGIAQVSGQLGDAARLGRGVVQPEFGSTNLGTRLVIEHNRIPEFVFSRCSAPIHLFLFPSMLFSAAGECHDQEA